MIIRNKLGRNDPCSCGSGLKYKKCCLLKENRPVLQYREVPIEVEREFQKMNQQKIDFENQHGKLRPIISTRWQGKRVIAIGNLAGSFPENCTFLDVLSSYIKYVLTPDWLNAELEKPFEERHQIIKWDKEVCEWEKNPTIVKNGLFGSPLIGIPRAHFQLAYDLYVLRHHSLLQAQIVSRLKDSANFQGARYELAIASLFIIAGFDIEYEDESDPKKKHPEFIATHKNTGEKVAVEAKSRHRYGVLGFESGQPNFEDKVGIDNLLFKACEKKPEYPYIICLDLNLPPTKKVMFDEPWFAELQISMDKIISKYFVRNDKLPFNSLLFTNFSSHYGEMGKLPHSSAWLVNAHCEFTKYPIKNLEMFDDLYNALGQYGNIPNFFSHD